MFINKISEYEFQEIKNSFSIIMGNYATYNEYFNAEIDYLGSQIFIGIQTITGGIQPKIKIINEKLLVMAGSNLNIYDSKLELIKNYEIDSIYYDMIECKMGTLIISELSVYLLNNNFEILWLKEFDEIIDLIDLTEKYITLCDYNNKNIVLDISTGKEK